MIWTVGKDGTVVKCSYKCERDHDHFIGSYEKAMKFLVGPIDQTKGKKKLKDIVMTHQLDERMLTKTSAELYSILMSACETKQYWIPSEQRHQEVMDTLDECERDHLIMDKQIFEKFDPETSPGRMGKRLYRLQQWERNIKYAPR